MSSTSFHQLGETGMTTMRQSKVRVNHIINPLRPMESSIKFNTVKSGCPLCIMRGHRLSFPKILCFFL